MKLVIPQNFQVKKIFSHTYYNEIIWKTKKEFPHKRLSVAFSEETLQVQ